MKGVGRALIALLVAAFGTGAVAAERALDKEVLLDAFHIHMDPGAEPGMKGADDMRSMALQSMKMLSFDWNAPPSLPQVRAERTFVVVRFFPVDDRHTRVTPHHTGWGDGGEWDAAYAYFDRAWTGVLGQLRPSFERGPRDWAPWLQQLEEGRRRPSPMP